MLSKEEVAEKLREAAVEIQRLAAENKSLMEKIASLEAGSAVGTGDGGPYSDVPDEGIAEDGHNFARSGAGKIVHDHEADSALQKEAGSVGFTPRSGFGFGSASEEPVFSVGTELSPEERLDMILRGESPVDFE